MNAAGDLACGLCRLHGGCCFSGLDAESFREFRVGLVSNRYRRKQVVFYEGHRPHGVWLVCAGRVKVFKSDGKGHQLTTRVVGAGGLIGYRSFLAGEAYAATAEALEDSTLSYVDGPVLRAMIAAPGPLAEVLLAMLARDLGAAEDMARDLAMKSSRERLAELLLNLVGTTTGDAKVTLAYTRLDLAELAGLAEETVIRLLSEFEAEGIILLDGRTLEIRDPGRLRRLAGEGGAGLTTVRSAEPPRTYPRPARRGELDSAAPRAARRSH